MKQAYSSVGYCEASDRDIERLTDSKKLIPITEDACGQAGLKWKVFKRSADFFCGRPSHTSRDNHHGQNGQNGHSYFDWTVPGTISPDQNCALRIRYNITTGDYATDIDFTKNRPNVGENVGFQDAKEAQRRGWELKNDPDVSIFDFMADAKLELNVQTQQYGRTFEDRSHAFLVNAKADDKVHELTVVGELGGPVSVYPSVMYGITPEVLSIEKGDKVHFHWSISDLERQNQDRQWTRQKMTQNYDTSLFDWSENANVCFKSSNIDGSKLHSFDNLLTMNSSCEFFDFEHRISDDMPLHAQIFVAGNGRKILTKSSEALTSTFEELEFSTGPNSPQISVQPLTNSELADYNKDAAASLQNKAFTGGFEIIKIEPANSIIDLRMRSGSDQAVVYYWNQIGDFWSLIEPSNNGDFYLENSHRKDLTNRALFLTTFSFTS